MRVALNKMENNKASGNKGLSQKSSLKLPADTIFQKGFLTEEYFCNTVQKEGAVNKNLEASIFF